MCVRSIRWPGPSILRPDRSDMDTWAVSAELTSSTDLIVGLDYGQFTLETGESDPDLATERLEVAVEDGIAQRDDLVVIVSPHQNNFAMPLQVEVWTSEPANDLHEWEEAFEVHLDVGEQGLLYGSPTMDYMPLAIPSGSYQALISGRGFAGHGWPGSTHPGDSWRIRVWPSGAASTPRRLKAFED